MDFTGVKIFSTTLARDRDQLSEKITGWLRDHPEIEIVDKVVTQSSDKEFHCLSLTFFFREKR
jgi:folate-dependent tRNA-U54 methylase TrmFO/GidA